MMKEYKKGEKLITNLLYLLLYIVRINIFLLGFFSFGVWHAKAVIPAVPKIKPAQNMLASLLNTPVPAVKIPENVLFCHLYLFFYSFLSSFLLAYITSYVLYSSTITSL